MHGSDRPRRSGQGDLRRFVGLPRGHFEVFLPRMTRPLSTDKEPMLAPSTEAPSIGTMRHNGLPLIRLWPKLKNWPNPIVTEVKEFEAFYLRKVTIKRITSSTKKRRIAVQ